MIRLFSIVFFFGFFLNPGISRAKKKYAKKNDFNYTHIHTQNKATNKTKTLLFLAFTTKSNNDSDGSSVGGGGYGMQGSGVF